MAGSAIKERAELNVLLVRHGESVNNPLHAEIFRPVIGEPTSSSRYLEAEERWLRERSDDPALTPKGLQEAQLVADHFAPLLEAVPGRVRLFVSPFLRTCQTAAPLAQRLGPRCRVAMRAAIHEVGGVYTPGPGGRTGPGQCLSAEEIERRYPGFDTAALAGPRGEGWYTGGFETDAEARERVAAVAAWLKSPELLEECGGGSAWAVLVVHGHFIDNLLKALLGIADDPLEDGDATNTMFGRQVMFFTPNTAVGRLSVFPGGRVALHYLGSTSHLGGASAL